jgi:hypothetical protein
MRDLFEWLTPPPQGVQGLRSKLDEADGKNSPAGSFAAGRAFFSPARIFAASLLALVVASGLIFSSWRPGDDEPRRDYGIFQSVMDGPAERAAVVLPEELNPRLKLVRLESSDPKVKLYWIEESDG